MCVCVCVCVCVWPSQSQSSYAVMRQLLFILDIYITMMSETLHVAPRGYYVATISTRVETENPEDELKPALDLLEPIMQKYVARCHDNTPLQLRPQRISFYQIFCFFYEKIRKKLTYFSPSAVTTEITFFPSHYASVL